MPATGGRFFAPTPRHATPSLKNDRRNATHLEGIVSADKIFDVITNLKRFDPLALFPEDH
ncbi:MAG: hypothetical protein Q7R39_05235 [Dehalococcoidia bacterium]|nr:hypothetical protein [Dehalococcoidia bacterium]